MLSKIPVINHLAYPLPSSLERIVDLTNNLWWSWDETGRALWSTLDPDQWERTPNPIDILQLTEPSRWMELERLESVQDAYRAAVTAYDEYLTREDTWFSRHASPVSGSIAYLCTEYGVHNSLPLYSGGLGILAGDHVKTAS